MYIQLTNEKEQPFTVMASAIIYFEDIVHTNQDVKAKLVVHGHAFNVRQSSADIQELIENIKHA
jgi:hypothetical protein